MIASVGALLIPLNAGVADAAAVLTGDAEADFIGPEVIIVVDPAGKDVGVPSSFPPDTVSGIDMKDVRFSYDLQTDSLHVAFNAYGVAGDVDGDGDAGHTSPALANIGGSDRAEFGGGESFALLLDIDVDGRFDIIAGVPTGMEIGQFLVSRFNPDSGVVAAPGLSLNFTQTLPEHVGGVFASPDLEHPDIEFTILRFSELPTTTGGDDGPELIVSAFVGSYDDAGIGDDAIPGLGSGALTCFDPTDGDGNGVPDCLDPDGDAIRSDDEVAIGTDPYNPDSDGDGLGDYDETDGGQYVDTDEDGTMDALDLDSDDDGVLDEDEAGDGDIVTAPPDTDGDGVPDYRDLDSDDDSLPDSEEAGDSDPNTPPRDTDGDGIGDFQQIDSDADGTIDPVDNCRFTYNADQLDTDLDGLGDSCDEDDDADGLLDVLEDVDGDGVLDPGETDPTDPDTDGDGLADGLEDANLNGVRDPRETDPRSADTDQDGVEDGVEDTNLDGHLQPGETDPLDADTDDDSLSDGQESEAGLPVDTDGDGVIDALDSDSDNDGLSDAQEAGDTDLSTAPADHNSDGLPDFQDPDRDDDEVLDGADNCIHTPNTDQLDTDEDGVGDVCDDSDSDGVVDPEDNCVDIYNPDQADADHDGEGNVCDDSDFDGTFDDSDNCPGVANPLQEDMDSDGIGDQCDDSDWDESFDFDDNCPRTSNPDQSDADGDGIGDACDPDTDEDQDGVQHELDNCPEVSNPDQADFDQDGIGDACDAEDSSRVHGAGGFGACDSGAGGASGAPALGLLLLAGLLRRRRAAVVGAALAGVGATTAVAQEAVPFGVNVQQFEPAPAAGSDFVTVHGGRSLEALQPALGLWVNYAHRPLVLTVGESSVDLIRPHLAADLVAALGLGSGFQLGIALPMTLYQAPGSQEGLQAPAIAAHTIGDVRLMPRWGGALGGGGLSMAFMADISLPTGDPESYLGNDGVTVEPRVVVEQAVNDRLRVVANLSYVIRNASHVYALDVDDQLAWGAAVAWQAQPQTLSLMAEIFGRVGQEPDGGLGVDDVPVEMSVSARWQPVQGHLISLGGGPGLTSGFGSPVARAFVGYSYQGGGWANRDSDGDGLLDVEDGCPAEAEDFDDFQDDDGCPDPDNDGDGLVGEADVCPDRAEDFDGFADADGCPDKDNDEDGVLDGADACPNDPEDDDNFEDADGCPEPDNDKDGFLDASDPCPKAAEDFDGFQDNDGCPDPDNDGDGVLDAVDQCPDEAEVLNAVDDEDGCPDEGKSLVRVTSSRIEILDRVYFETSSATLQSVSSPVLDQVVSALKLYPSLTRVRIEGHTDSQGDDTKNLELSEARAEQVRQYLIDGGIDAQRLVAEGFGETRPLATNDTSDGRAQNRRVEFYIVEVDGAPVPAPEMP